MFIKILLSGPFWKYPSEQKHVQSQREKTLELLQLMLFECPYDYLGTYFESLSRSLFLVKLQAFPINGTILCRFTTGLRIHFFMTDTYKNQQAQICQSHYWVKDHDRFIHPNYNFFKWFALRLRGSKQRRFTRKSCWMYCIFSI